MQFPCLVNNKFCKTPVIVTLYREGTSEDGEPLTALTFSGSCNYQDSAKSILTADKRLVKISAQLYFNGDIAPDIPDISDGEVEIYGSVRKITGGMKARNPDGTVNYTRLDLM